MGAWGCRECAGDNPEGTRFCGWCGVRRAEVPVEAGAEENRLVTAVFADISGFTTLADKLDPEALHEVISPVISRLADLATRYGGHVAKYAGDAVLVFFGAPVAHDDDPERALLLALDMHAEMAKQTPYLPPEAAGMDLHIGVNTGRVISGAVGGGGQVDYSILGDAVILAQRLESVAPGGATYVGEATVALVGDRFAFEDLGLLTLKGKLEPVRGFRMLGRADVSDAPRRQRTPLLGRDAEVAAVLAGLRNPARGAVGVVGEPGVGKTRLHQAVREARIADGVVWLDGRCSPHGSGSAYNPLSDLIGELSGVRPGDDAEHALPLLAETFGLTPLHAAVLGRLVGVHTPDPVLDQMDADAFRRTLFDAVASWFPGPDPSVARVLAVEDVHCADAATRDLLDHLAGRCEGTASALLLTSRDEGRGWVADAVGDALLELRPLSPDAVRQVVTAVLDGEPPEELVETVLERADGNPLFVEQVLASLLDQGVLAHERGAWRMRPGWSAAGVPLTLEGVLASRLDLLPPRELQVLQTAAALGRRVAVTLLSSLEPDAAVALASLVEAGFLDPVPDEVDELAFHHALAQEVAYGRLLRRTRRDLHRRIAYAVVSLYGDGDDVVDVLARHLWLGDAGRPAIDALLRATAKARGVYAHDLAIDHLRHAQEACAALRPPDERLHEVELELADLLELGGRFDEARGFYASVAAAVGDARAHRGLASTERKQGRYDEALAVLDRALLDDRLVGDVRLLWSERARTLSQSGDVPGSDAAAVQGIEVDPAATDAVMAELLMHRAYALQLVGDLEAALVDARRMSDLAADLDDARLQVPALRLVGTVLQAQGDSTRAAQALEQAADLARRTGQLEEAAGCSITLGLVLRDMERYDDALHACLASVEQFEAVGHGSGRVIGYANLAELQMLRGELEEATTWAERCRELARSIGHALAVADSTATLGQVAARRGDRRAAVALLEEAVQLFVDAGAARLAADILVLVAEQHAELADSASEQDARRRAQALAAAEA